MPALPIARPSTRHLLAPIALTVLLTLAACGAGGTSDDPTATSAPVASPTLVPGQVSVGSLLDRIDAAWPAVTSMVATSWTGAYADPLQALAAPPTDQMITVEKVVKPAARSITSSIGGVAVDEQLAVNGVAYFRGQTVTTGIAPFVDASTWVRVEAGMVAEDSPVGQQLAYLISPLAAPYGSVSAELRAHGATKTGQVSVGGRTCDVYSFADNTSDDAGIAYTLSLDSAGLPCSLTQSAGGYANVTTWTFNDLGLTITPPADAIPMSGAGAATPAP